MRFRRVLKERKPSSQTETELKRQDMTSNCVALVTGANKGLGQEVARQLGRRGMTVLLGCRDRTRGETAAAELVAEGLDVAPTALDVTQVTSAEAVADHIRKTYGRLDVLINNAGIHVGRPALEIRATEMRKTFETNVFGVVTMINIMLPLLKEAPEPRIVNVASTTASLALTSDPTSLFGQENNSLAYASSKSAVTMLTVQYANALRRLPAYAHVKINAVTPGYIATDLNGHTGPRSVEQGARIVIDLATIAHDGPSCGFFNDDGSVPW
jgi:NAD(P)-dependent dehydrogenase (short-subunit alcohol dehydrogenase family)